MNIKAYLLSSLVAPIIGLMFIIVGLSIDISNGHLNIAEELEDDWLVYLLFSYFLFVVICFIATFVIILLSKLFKTTSIDNPKNYFIMGGLVGMVAALITLFLMESGNLTRENGLFSLQFGTAGILFGLLTSMAYYKLEKKSYKQSS